MNRRLIFAVLALLCAGAVSAQERTEAPAASSEVRYVGRTQTNGGDVSFDWSGTCFECRFTGGSLAMRVSDTKKNYYNLTVDGRDAGVVTTFGTDSVVVLAEKLGRGEHTVRMQKRTEGEQGRTTIHAFLLDRGRRLLPAAPAPGRHIEFIGNSLTCGYGTEGLSKDEPFKPQTENCNKAYACIIARYFGADYTLIAHSGRGAARNYGDKNATSQNTMADRVANTFDEAAEPAWDFAASPYRPDLVVINLGSTTFRPCRILRAMSLRPPIPVSCKPCAALTATKCRSSAWRRASANRPSPISATCVRPASCRTSISRLSCPATATTGANSDRRPIPIMRDIARWRCC